MWALDADLDQSVRVCRSRSLRGSSTVSRYMHRLRLLAFLPLMAAVLLCHSGCGRLGYEEHSRTPDARQDAGTQPAPDDDAGDPQDR